jgi:hypothetical protein
MNLYNRMGPRVKSSARCETLKTQVELKPSYIVSGDPMQVLVSHIQGKIYSNKDH